MPLDDLASTLARLGGHAQRCDPALTRVMRDENRRVDGLGIDCGHAVWMLLHEELLATLGLDRSDKHSHNQLDSQG